MQNRNLLRSQLLASWDWTVHNPYLQMLINSERGLQIHFCMRLLRAFDADHVDRRLFVEPTIILPSGERRYPDLMICNSRRVIGVVELKYTPRSLPKTDKDFASLAMIGGEDHLVVSNERFRGQKRPRAYELADDAVMCWAAIHADRPFNPDRTALDRIGARYLELRAIASELDVQVVGNPVSDDS